MESRKWKLAFEDQVSRGPRTWPRAEFRVSIFEFLFSGKDTPFRLPSDFSGLRQQSCEGSSLRGSSRRLNQSVCQQASI